MSFITKFHNYDIYCESNKRVVNLPTIHYSGYSSIKYFKIFRTRGYFKILPDDVLNIILNKLVILEKFSPSNWFIVNEYKDKNTIPISVSLIDNIENVMLAKWTHYYNFCYKFIDKFKDIYFYNIDNDLINTMYDIYGFGKTHSYLLATSDFMKSESFVKFKRMQISSDLTTTTATVPITKTMTITTTTVPMNIY